MDCPTLACALGVVVLPFVIFWPVALGRQVWVGGDFSTHNYPLFVVSAEQWRHRHLPLWNPYLYAEGAPSAYQPNPSW